MNTRLKSWHRLVGILIAQGKVGEALAYAESAKSRGLLDTMQTGHAVVTDAMTEPEQQQERRLNHSALKVQRFWR